MKLARFFLAVLAIAALGVGCSDLPTDAGPDTECPTQGGPWC